MAQHGPRLGRGGSWSPGALATDEAKPDIPAPTHYGTFKIESIHGRLLELDAYLEVARMRCRTYFLYVMMASLLWPIAWLLALYTGKRAQEMEQKTLAMATMLLYLGTLLGVILWTVPIVLIFVDGGFSHFMELIDAEVLSMVDISEFMFSELILLLFVQYCWVYCEINTDIDKCKKDARGSWQHRSGEHGMQVVLGDNQMLTFEKVVSDLNHSFTPRPDGGSAVFIDDIISVLEKMPGWDSALETASLADGKDIESEGFFTKLGNMQKKATSTGLWAIDVFMIWGRDHERPWRPTQMEALTLRMKVASQKVLHSICSMYAELRKSPAAFIGIFVFALFRAVLPRCWIIGVRGGDFLPSNLIPLIVTLNSCAVRFFTSFLWLSTFYVCVAAYRTNVNQVMLISAIVDPRIRMRYTMEVLMEAIPDEDEAKQVLKKLPLLDLKKGTNVAAFWRLREYCMLDRSNERMAMEVLMEMLILWIIMNFLVTALTVYFVSPLTPLIVVTVLDLLVFGFMLLIGLAAALDVNTLMANHVREFVEARYSVTLSLAQAKELHLCNVREHHHSKKSDDHEMRDLKESRQLLSEYIAMVQEYDVRDTILLGCDVTPGSIISTIVTVGAMVGSILFRAHRSGMLGDLSEEVAKEGGEAMERWTPDAITMHRSVKGTAEGVKGVVKLLSMRAARAVHR